VVADVAERLAGIARELDRGEMIRRATFVTGDPEVAREFFAESESEARED
jgi:hypothetical protein